MSLVRSAFVYETQKPDSLKDTTRSPRPGEVDGAAYHFVTKDEFRRLIDQKAFIEYAEFSGNYYGTSVQAVEDVKKTGKRCILDIDAQVSRLS